MLRACAIAVLRLVDLSSDKKLEDGQNLLAHTRKHMNLSSNDVQWRPKHDSHFATGATTGDVLLWDIERRGDALLRTMRGHSRAVNRLCFNPAQPSQLLIAAHERTVRLWDVGQRLSTQQLTFTATSEVRDVQFNPHVTTRFVVALENGMVQIFDVRSNKTHLHQLQAHHGPVYCAEWHPTERVTSGKLTLCDPPSHDAESTQPC
jgi:WD40 repeat protein